MTPLFGRLFDALDARLGTTVVLRHAANKVFPKHWSFLLGEVAVIAFGVLVLTGIFLTMFYRASTDPVTYTGSAELFTGRELPASFESVVRLTHDVPGGLLFRRIHRVAAHVFVIAILLHLLRVILTGAFRRPRELNYHLGILMLFLAVASAYSGHNLIFDVLAGTSLRILYSFLLSVPFVGEAVAQWVFAGEFPTGDFIPRLYIAHVLVLPGLTALAIGLHLTMLVRQTHTQFSRPGIDDRTTVVGEPAWPGQAAKSLTLALAVVGLVAAFAVLVPWSDVDLHGPYIVAQATNASQPDWFLFWVEGALRLYPGWDPTILGVTFSAALVSGVLLPLLLMTMLFAYPWLERTVVGLPRDPFDHHELQGPLDVPFRVGFVTAVFTVLLVLTASAGHDVVARNFRMPIETVTWVLRIAVLVLPVVTGLGAALYARAFVRRRELRVPVTLPGEAEPSRGPAP